MQDITNPNSKLLVMLTSPNMNSPRAVPRIDFTSPVTHTAMGEFIVLFKFMEITIKNPIIDEIANEIKKGPSYLASKRKTFDLSKH